MILLIRAELRKLFTTKLWWAMMLGAMAISALAVIATILSDGIEGNDTPPLTTPETQRSLFGSSGFAGVFVLIVGIIAMTTEFRHFTSRPTFLFEPRRWRIVAAKFVANAGLGLLYSVVCAALVTAIILPWLSAKDIDVSITGNGIPGTLVATIAAVAIYGVVGVGLGVLIRNQIVAVICALSYLFVLEPLMRAIPGVKEIYRFLPGGAIEALTDASTQTGVDLLGRWPAAAVLIGWGLLFGATGSLLTVRRDIP